MNRTKSEKGQALILIAFGIIALIGFTALAVDGGRIFSDRRNAQNAADTAALAAALDQIRADYGLTTLGYEQSGLNRAADNGYDNDGTWDIVTVMFCDDAATAGDACTGLPPGANPSEYIRVRIISNVRLTFGKVLGREFVTNKVEAISRVQGSASNPVFNAGAGMYATKMDNYDDCFKVLGSAELAFHNTGIFVNCSGDDALSFGGSADIYMEANAQVVGCSDDQGFPIQGTGTIDCGVNGGVSQTITADTFADVPTTEPTPVCTTQGQHNLTTDTMSPGYFSNAVNLSDPTTFLPGKYCFLSGFTLGNQSVNLTGTGKVQWVLSSSPSLAGTADFEDLEIFASSDNFTIKNSGTLTTDRFRFFGNGNSSLTVQGGTLISGNAYIYSESGEIDIQAQAHVDIEAPDEGGAYDGLLMYMPWDNPNSFELNGGTDDIWKGTVLMPGAEVTYNGSSGFTLYGQVIAETFKINGNTGGDIFYNSDYVYSPPNDPTIEFTK